jgi:mRNA-binding protein PUF3
LRPCDSQFIVDEILQRGPGAAIEAAEHKYGCRILQRLLEHFPSDRLQNLIDDILAEAVNLCKHDYGSFFMQHLCEYGDENHVSKLLHVLTHHASSIASDPYGVSVYEKALTHCSGDAHVALANLLASQPSSLVSMSYWRHGYMAAKLALQAAAPSQRKSAFTELQRHEKRMNKSRYGKKTDYIRAEGIARAALGCQQVRSTLDKCSGCFTLTASVHVSFLSHSRFLHCSSSARQR